LKTSAKKVWNGRKLKDLIIAHLRLEHIRHEEMLTEDRCRNRRHPKRHGVGKERSQIDRGKYARAMEWQEEPLATWEAYVVEPRLYWLGSGSHP
jgi:hypothetical protein